MNQDILSYHHRESQKPEPIHEFISLSVLFLRHPVPRERPPYMVLKTTWQA